MRFTKRRTEYLLRRWVGKQAVAAAAGLPSDLSSPGPHRGRQPAHRCPGRARRRRAASISTSRSPTAPGGRSAWSGRHLGRSSGCDLEIVEPRSPGFVTDFLTAAEQRYVAARPDGRPRRGRQPPLVGQGERAQGAADRAAPGHPQRRGRGGRTCTGARGRRGERGVGPLDDPHRRGRPAARVVAPRRRLPGDGRLRAAATARRRRCRASARPDERPCPSTPGWISPLAPDGDRSDRRASAVHRQVPRRRARAIPRSSASMTYGRSSAAGMIRSTDPTRQGALDGVDGVELVGHLAELLRTDLLRQRAPAARAACRPRRRPRRRWPLRSSTTRGSFSVRDRTSRAKTVAAAGAPPITEA